MIGPVKPVVAIDFDGVLNSYRSGMQPGPILDPPVPGAIAWLHDLEPFFQLVIFTVRAEATDGAQLILDWLDRNQAGDIVVDITATKPAAAIIFVDDRGWRFTGEDYPDPTTILAALPWWKTEAEGKPLDPITGTTVAALSASLTARAAAMDFPVTDTVTRAVTSARGALDGLPDRLKSPESTSKKIAAVATEKNLDLPAAAADLKDALRFTAIFPAVAYVGGIDDVLARLATAGLTVERLRNYWTGVNNSRYPDGTYLGVNVVLRALNGFLCELQIHTPESLGVQYENRELYRTLRDQGPDASVAATMLLNNSFVQRPPGIDSLTAAIDPPPGIPVEANYRPASDFRLMCATCDWYDLGHCEMFSNADVVPTWVCDDWETIGARGDGSAAASLLAASDEDQKIDGPPATPQAPLPDSVPATHHNRVLAASEKRAWELEQRLVRILKPILEQAGTDAAAAFEQKATRHLTASAVLLEDWIFQVFDAGPDDDDVLPTMVALIPRPEQAADLAHPDGLDPDLLHVTLVYLGKTTGSLDVIRDALMPVSARHAPLMGQVGGVGVFGDNGEGHPAIALPSVPGLVELRVEATQALQAAGIDYGREYGYQPHLTLGYRDTPNPPAVGHVGKPLTFDSLWIVRGDTERIEMPLTGSKPVTASADPFLDDLVRAMTEPIDPVDRKSTDRLTFTVRAAAGEPTSWSPPAGDEILDVDALVQTLRTKTDPVRQAVIETTMKSSLNGVGIDYDVTNPLTAKVLAQSGSQITNIAETTQLNVMRIIRTSYEQGLTIPDTAKAIRAGMSDAAGYRSTLIARTELAGAVNGGSLAATQIVSDATGTGYQKQWLTAEGAHYPRHELYEGLDGQTVELEAYFDVGGAQLQFPGDPAGPPEEVCNCRCTLVYLEHGQETGQGVSADEGGVTPDQLEGTDEGGSQGLAQALSPPVKTTEPAAAPPETAPAPVAHDLSAENTLAKPPVERPFAHWAPATLKTQLYRSKTTLRDLLAKQADRGLTADEQRAFDQHMEKLRTMIQEKRLREAGTDRPFAHYAEPTLKTQIYRAKKEIGEIRDRAVKEGQVGQADLDKLTNLEARLAQLIREQQLRGVEEDIGGAKVKPPPKERVTRVVQPPEPVVPAPTSFDLTTRMGRLQNAYANRRVFATRRDAENAMYDFDSPYAGGDWELRVDSLGQDFADELAARFARQHPGRDLKFATPGERRLAITDLLGEIRPMGIDPYDTKGPFVWGKAPGSDAGLANMAQQAADLYPRDWVNLAAERPPVQYVKDARGYFRERGAPGGGHRIAVSQAGREPVSGDPKGFSTMVHEIAHMMEREVPGVRALEHQFYIRRAMPNGEAFRAYRWGDKGEWVRPDEFVDEYIGKDYSYQGDKNAPAGVEWLEPPGADDSYEILSMGMEGVMNGENALWERDANMRNFILGLLVSL